MLKNMTASEIKRMTTDGKTVMKKINRQHFERLRDPSTIRLDFFILEKIRF